MTTQLINTFAIFASETDTPWPFVGGTFAVGSGPRTDLDFTAEDDDAEFSSLSTQPAEAMGGGRQLGTLRDGDGTLVESGVSSLVNVATLVDPATGNTLLMGRVAIREDTGESGGGAILQEFFIFSSPVDPDVTYNVTDINYSPGDGPENNFGYSTFQNSGVVCFEASTLIQTATGRHPVHLIRRGDLVQTVDNGLQPVLWSGQTLLSSGQLAGDPRLWPIVIAAGQVGNDRPLVVSQQHRVAVHKLFVKAKHLPRIPGFKARMARGKRHISYHHLLFEHHEVLIANGAEAESLFAGPMALSAMPKHVNAEVRNLGIHHDHSDQGLARPMRRACALV